MRINVYEEELTDDVEVVQTVADNTGITYFGVRMYLKSAPELHNTELDDDRSAVTIWVGVKENAVIIRDAIRRGLTPVVK